MTDRLPYEWPEGKRSAFCFSVDVDAEAPYLWANREGLPPLLGQLEQRRFGPREGLWRILDMLDRVSVKGSFYVPGITAELHPEILPALVERGHEIGLHGHLHEIVSQSSHKDFVAALDRSLDLFAEQAGVRPTGFRSPAWEMTPAMIAALKEHGLRYDSSLMGRDHPYSIDGLTEIPVQWQVDDAVYFRFFGGGVDKWPPLAAHEVRQSWLDEFKAGQAFGALFMLTVHPWISGRSQRVAMLESLIDKIVADETVWCATAEEIAEWHAGSVNAGCFQDSSSLAELEAAISKGRAQ